MEAIKPEVTAFEHSAIKKMVTLIVRMVQFL